MTPANLIKDRSLPSIRHEIVMAVLLQQSAEQICHRHVRTAGSGAKILEKVDFLIGLDIDRKRPKADMTAARSPVGNCIRGE